MSEAQETQEKSSQYERGEADAKAGNPPSELTKEYLRGFEEGRREYVASQRELRQLGWQPDFDRDEW